MSLESVFANPPPLVGEVNKDSTLYGENQSDDPVECIEMADEEEPTEDLEEGEIIDDSEGDIPEKDAEKEEATQEPAPADNGEEDLGDQDKKRRKKRKSRKERKDYGRDNKKRKKRKLYVDHDRVDEDGFDDRLSPYSTPPYPDSADENSGKEDNYINGSKGLDGNKRPKSKNSRFSGPKKRGPTHLNSSPKRNKRPPLLETPHIMPMCKFYKEEKCNKGSDCPYSHESVIKKVEVCKFYLNGYCAKGEECLYLHKEFPCKFFNTGTKSFQADENGKLLEKKSDGPFEGEEEVRPPRPSLLGSPPRHIKEAAAMRGFQRKIPSLFDIKVEKPSAVKKQTNAQQIVNTQPVNIQRPNFYDNNPKMSPKKPLLPLRPPNTSPTNSSAMSNSPPPDNSIDDSEEIDAPSNSESESDSKKQNIEIPSHLPKKQRELFLRIQQHQREIQPGGSDAADKQNGESDDNWYSSDDDDQPLTDVLKKLQQQPAPPATTSQVTPIIPHLVNSVNDSAVSYNIAKMLSVIRSVSITPVNARDPRLQNNNVSNRAPDLGIPKSLDVLPVDCPIVDQSPTSYQLRAITVTQPNPADRLRLLQASHNDPRLQSDPRLQKQLTNVNNTKPQKLVDPRLQKNLSLDSKPQDPRINKIVHTDQSQQDPRLQKSLSADNNRTADPRLVKNNKPADPRLQRAPPKPIDPRLTRLQTSPETTNENSVSSSKTNVRPIDPRLVKVQEKVPANISSPPHPSNDNKVQESQTSESKTVSKKPPLFEYSSPLATNEEPVSETSGYNSYNRPRLLQSRPKEISPPELIKSEPPQPTSVLPKPEELVGSLKDVFKTIDPTASPFC